MPLTPFHFGPALLIGYLLRRRMDLLTFLIANVILDVRAVLVFFGVLPEPIHGPLHQTYLGAFAAGLVFAGIVLLFTRQFSQVAQTVSSRPESPKAVVLAGVSGTLLHVTLDAFSHSGMNLFYPLPGNPLYNLVNTFMVYTLCVLAFMIFVAIAGFSTLRKIWKHGIVPDDPKERAKKTGIIAGIVISVAGLIIAAGTVSLIDVIMGLGTPDVTVERINSTHAAITWTTDEPTQGYIKTYVSHQCGPAWGHRTLVNTINDSSVSRTHLITAPVYDLKPQVNVMNVPGDGPIKWYQIEAVSAGDSDRVGTSIVSRNLSRTC